MPIGCASAFFAAAKSKSRPWANVKMPQMSNGNGRAEPGRAVEELGLVG
jgi:hypothetical protein